MVATAGADGSSTRSPETAAPTPVTFRRPSLLAPAGGLQRRGDAYVCGFLTGGLAGRDLKECARLGAIAGAYACTAPGSTALISRQLLLSRA